MYIIQNVGSITSNITMVCTLQVADDILGSNDLLFYKYLNSKGVSNKASIHKYKV